MTVDEQFYIYTLTDAGQGRRLASPLATDFTNQHGLCEQAMAGEFTSSSADEDSPETFTANPEVVRFLQWALAKHAPAAPGFKERALADPEGSIFIVDIRGVHRGFEPKDEDLIGIVQLAGGQPRQFQASPNYKVLTEHGFLRIDPWLRQKYIEELQLHALNKKQS